MYQMLIDCNAIIHGIVYKCIQARFVIVVLSNILVLEIPNANGILSLMMTSLMGIPMEYFSGYEPNCHYNPRFAAYLSMNL